MARPIKDGVARNVRITIRLSEQDRAALLAVAGVSEMSVNDHVLKAIQQYVRRKRGTK